MRKKTKHSSLKNKLVESTDREAGLPDFALSTEVSIQNTN
jgi:hypothetical protein